jgi:hypothetical protein
LTAVVALAMTSSACGARLSNKQRTLAIQQGTGNNVGTTTTNGSSGANAGGTTGTAATTGGTVGTKGTTGSSTTTGTATGGSAGQTCTATSANNGGKTDTGVTSTQISVANISDISGPVPGLFKSARDASQAYVNYFNTTNPNGICGRKLKLDTKDSKTDSGANKTATKAACASDFALTGGQSAFDDGGADEVSKCKIVDIPAAAVTGKRQATAYTYAALSTNKNEISAALPNYFKGKFGTAVTQHAGFLYIDAGAAKENGENNIKAYEKVGWKFVYTAAVPIPSATPQGMKPYVQHLKDAGATFVQWIGAYQQAAYLASAMSQSSYKPTVYLTDPTAYIDKYVQQAGASAEGTYVYSPTTLYDSGVAEMQLYAQWLRQSGVSDQPTFFGQAAWSAMRLFTDMAFKVGPKLTRPAVLAQLKKVDNWTGNGITSKQHVGQKKTGQCVLMMQVKGGRFTKIAPAGDGYLCDNLITI